MKILEGLLRLRQICIHPRWWMRLPRRIGKFELLLETLDTLHAEGHKALVFSQFVQMLKPGAAELDERQHPLYLPGRQTRDRQERVDPSRMRPEPSPSS
jgi:non-specific serine/threonine protein kinase